MTRVFLPLALLLLAPGGRAEEDEVPLPFFRTPDRDTRKRIVHAVSDKGLGSGTRDGRRQSRAELVEIGPWAVPFLAEALTRGTESIRVRMNAAITLAWIGERHAIAALDKGAVEDGDTFVRRTCCLALGKFREHEALRAVLKARQGSPTWAAAALAIAKARDLEAAREEIEAAVARKPSDPPFVAALLVATALLEKDPRVIDEFLGHKDKLLRRAAVTCRLIRPLPPTRAPLLVKRLKVERDREIRALLYHALGAAGGAEDLDVRDKLLTAATQTKEKKPARIAAALELAWRYPVLDNSKKLLGALRTIRSRSDPVVGALIFALAQTGHPDAIDKLETITKTPKEGLRSFYAAGSLFYLACHGRMKESEAEEIVKYIVNKSAREPSLDALVKVLRSVQGKERAQWWQEALKEDAKIQGRKPLSAPRLWTVSPEDRAWAKLNLLLPYIFRLDDIVDTRDMSAHAPTEPVKGQGATDDSGGKGGDGGSQTTGGKRSAAGKPEEQDLIDFLKDPYFVREDLRGG